MSEWARIALLEALKHGPISKPEFRKRTGLCQSYVQDTFTEAELLGEIRETEERFRDRSKHIRRPSIRYEAVS